MKTVIMQLERLRRHHAVAVNSHDDISLLDLSHTLRIWTELKQPLVDLSPNFSKTMSFKTAAPPKRYLRAVQNDTSVIAYFPGGVRTRAHKGHIVSAPPGFVEGKVFAIGGEVKNNSDGSLEFKSYHVIISDESRDVGDTSGKIKRLNYAQWMGAEAVRIKTAGQNSLSISREMVIKRIANTLDGSHSSASKDEPQNQFDAPIHQLLNFEVAGLRLPYLILLKIAQDILEIAPPLLAKEVTSRYENGVS